METHLEEKTHLDKAKGALEHAKEFDNRSPQQDDLLVIARIQAEVAQAEALVRIAVALENFGQVAVGNVSLTQVRRDTPTRAEERARERELTRVDL